MSESMKVQMEPTQHPIVKQCIAENIRPCEQCGVYHQVLPSKELCELCRKDWKFNKFKEII